MTEGEKYMQELNDFFVNRVNYQIDPCNIFRYQFPQFKAMYNFIAPFIHNIKKTVVLDGSTYMVYPLFGGNIMNNEINNSTLEIDGIVYIAKSQLLDNYILLNVLDS